MLPRRTLLASAAALAAGCGPFRSTIPAPSVPKAVELYWAVSLYSSVFDPPGLSPREKYQQAVAAIAADREKSLGSSGTDSRITLHYVERQPRLAEFGAWLEGAEVDLVTVSPERARAAGDNGELLPLDRFLGSNDPAIEATFFPSVLEQFRTNALYALPVSARPLVVYYAADYFAAERIPPIDQRWDWEVLVRNALKLTQRRDDGSVARWGLEAHGSQIWWALWQNDADLADSATLHCRLPESAAVEALQFVHDLVHTHRVSPPAVYEDLMRLVWQPTGVPPAMVYGITPRRPGTGQYRIAELPRGKVRSVPVSAGFGIGIAARTKAPQVAYEALKGLVHALQDKVAVPAEIEALARLKDFRIDLRNEEVVALQRSMESGHEMPRLPQGEPVLHAMDTVVEGLVRGDDVTSVVNQACAIVREYEQT
ncbi:MAG: extracellular solute-binding protein [Chloroflexota bacterium]|nr:extracellular solute-binding protein [Chloroflexota bacterium]MDE2840378.1 extracellular solute-binding protein [Chloroflexota bacterium]MDE2929682.1 extracellular solute-binding protein [Chloroflexota bacterium]